MQSLIWAFNFLLENLLLLFIYLFIIIIIIFFFQFCESAIVWTL